MSSTLLLVGTRKGLWAARSDDDRRTWQVEGPSFVMNAVYAVALDTRGGRTRLLVSADSEHWGPSVFRSDDLGASWQETPEGAGRFPADTGAALKRFWALAPAPEDQPDVVWAGSEPSALWRSEDRGETFELVRGLWDHPHREQWGAGFGGQAAHTVLPHPTDPARISVAMSTGGYYRSSDGGGSWEPANKGIKAYFFPDPWPEFGQCVHKVDFNRARPDQLWAQNHHGVYRSDDAGSTWLSIAEGLPSDFGFPVVAHPRRPGAAYYFPLVADSERLPPDGRARVYRTLDEGASWEALTEGLPQEDFYGAVLRDAMCADDADTTGVYVGSRTGSVFASHDEGDSWSTLARDLPDVLCVRAATVG
jgi:hypothetical protein